MYKPNNVRLAYYIGCWVFYALFLSEVSWSPFVLVILKRWLSSWVKTAQQDFCIDENRFIFTDWIIMNKNTLKCVTVQWKTLHILPGVVVHSDHLFVFVCVYIGITCLLLSCSAARLWSEFKQREQYSNRKAYSQNQEDALHAMGSERRAFGTIWYTAAGPPLSAQVRQLPSLTQLQDGHAQVLQHWRSCSKNTVALQPFTAATA